MGGEDSRCDFTPDIRAGALEEDPQTEKRVYHVDPGYVFISKEPVVLRAVVGRAVVVCLWDRCRCCGGMAHYELPRTEDPSKATARYGNVALRSLVRLMEEEGCNRTDLVAQIIGGASRRFDLQRRMGAANLEVARKVLAGLGIEIVSTDVGGYVGRKIAFDTHSGETAVLKVYQLRAGDW
jgi:chemotaxis protein CheD